MLSQLTVTPHASAALQRTLGVLLSVIEEENAVLSHHDVVEHGTFTGRKNQALRELMAVQRAHLGIALPGDCQALLGQLKTSLLTNARLLQLNIKAVSEVSGIIIGAMREADSDGTYARTEMRARK